MTADPRRVTIEELDALCAALEAKRPPAHSYSGPLGRHVTDGDRRLLKLRFDESPAALRLWNFLLTEEERLRQAREAGAKLVGAMKDLGTVPVMAYSLPGLVAFYPDGAWWIPCVMELGAGLLDIASSLGAAEGLCPVRAMLGAFETQAHFPVPDLLTSSVGATCDDFSAIAQRLESMGYDILWWEVPARRTPDVGETAVELPGVFRAPQSQVDFVRSELERVRAALEELAGHELDDVRLADGIRAANAFRRALDELRALVYTSDPCPLPALEMLIAEMFALHFCSDREEAALVIEELLAEVRVRVAGERGVLPAGAARVFWVNPVADLRAMNLLEDAGGRLSGTEFLFCHALDEIPEDVPPMEALARTALADPMVGPAADRAERICRDVERFGAEAVVISRIPGASHCATEGAVIGEAVRDRMGLPVVELEVPPVADALMPTLRTRLEALVETALSRRIAPDQSRTLTRPARRTNGGRTT
ncbi:MAG: 2-hydroxyacyl-CoA dehydratase [Planctomycetota bacterium]|jgi:benzoyl-CoA reductase/2-hydroxyglutaryl-CoA dehydratase subunit BcrC/BadD/HgdB